MKNLIKHIGLSIGLILLLSLIIPLLPVGITTMPANATVGYTSVNITGTTYYVGASAVNRFANYQEMWALVNGDAGFYSTGTYLGFASSTTSQKYNTVCREFWRFDLSALPLGVTPTSAKVWTNWYKNDGTTWLDDYFYINKAMITTSSVSETTYSLAEGQAVTQPKAYNDIGTGAGAAAWYSHNIFSSQLNLAFTKTSGNYTWLSCMSGFDRFNVPITWSSGKSHVIVTSSVKLEVTYATPAASRTMNVLVNAADYTGVLTGSENVSAISWLTPRASFADDINGMGWRFEGSPGAAFNYSVSSDTGELIVSGNNTIKSNGYYYLYATVPVTWEGWLRAKSTDLLANTYYSLWGRVETPPNVNQRLLSVSATDTEYPQYDYEFSRYVIYKNGVGYLYWKTNLETADMANYHIKLMAGGDQVNATSWNATMQYLNDYYFFTKDSNNYDMAHWRYLAFTPYISTTGFNTYDGFIINAARDYSLTQTGFWQGAIRNNSDNSTLTYTDSAYFYLNDISQGVSISLAGYTVAASGEMVATITIGDHSKVGTRLRYLQVTLFDDLGEVAGSGTGFVSTGVNKVTFTAPVAVGDYQVRFKFYDTTLVPDYCYIKDIHFKVSAGGITTGEPPTASGFLAWLNALLESKGMNDTAGHWIIIILLCVLVAVIIGVFGKMPLVATVIDILIFGIAIYIKWIDPWIIILLALGAGFTIWRMFKRGSSSSGGAEE